MTNTVEMIRRHRKKIRTNSAVPVENNSEMTLNKLCFYNCVNIRSSVTNLRSGESITDVTQGAGASGDVFFFL